MTSCDAASFVSINGRQSTENLVLFDIYAFCYGELIDELLQNRPSWD